MTRNPFAHPLGRLLVLAASTLLGASLCLAQDPNKSAGPAPPPPMPPSAMSITVLMDGKPVTGAIVKAKATKAASAEFPVDPTAPTTCTTGPGGICQLLLAQNRYKFTATMGHHHASVTQEVAGPGSGVQLELHRKPKPKP